MNLLLLCAVLCWPRTDATPPVSLHELGRFPPAAVVEHQLGWHDLHRAWLCERRDACEHWTEAYQWWSDIVWAGDESRCVWVFLRDATNERLPEAERMMALRGLLGRLGVEDYYAGRMPQLWQWSCFQER